MPGGEKPCFKPGANCERNNIIHCCEGTKCDQAGWGKCVRK